MALLQIQITPSSIEAQYNPSGGPQSPTGHFVVEKKGMRLVSELPVAVYIHVEITAGDRYAFDCAILN